MPEHQWKKSFENEDREERECALCQLTDHRRKRGSMWAEPSGWKIATPCIEPVPERVSFDELVNELKENPREVEIEYGIKRIKTFDDLVLCIGRPGKWRVGLSFFDGLFPDKYGVTYQTLEEAYSALLRWMRARNYNPYLYSDLYRMQESARVRASSAAYDDD